MKQRVIIVGAGMIGAATALELARRGIAVTVLDANAPATGCSFGNSGLLSPGHAPLPAPGVHDNYLANRDNPAASGRYAPKDDPALDRWITSFSKSCTQHAYTAGMNALCALAPHVMPMFREWTAEITDPCDFRESGALVVTTTQNSLNDLRNYSAQLNAHNLPSELLDTAAIIRREPAATDAIIAAVFHPDWATIEPYRFVTAVMRRAQSLGATLRTHARVSRIESTHAELETGERIEADAVVIATGADAANLLAPFGIELPVASALGWHADLALKNPIRTAIVIADRDVILTPMESRLRVSGLVEITTTPPPAVDPSRIKQLLRGSDSIIQGIEGEVVSTWVGRRPCVPDGLPVIGTVPNTQGIFVATAHARMGLTLGPLTGRLIAQMISTETPSAPIEPFTPARFVTQHA